jgi:hypothetical protein
VRLSIRPGAYFHQGWSRTSPPHSYNNKHIVKLNGHDHIILEAHDLASPPTLYFDGAGAIDIRNCEYIEIRRLIIEGPNDRISGHEASLERQRRAGRRIPTGETTGACSPTECGSCLEQTTCTAAAECKWSDTGSKCGASSRAYYTGNGIAVWPGSTNSKHILIEENTISKCPGSGIRANKADHLVVRNNVVFDNVWWTTAASSGLVFAESAGTGTNTITGNVVYGNRNFMPFFYEDLSSLAGAHEAADGYSSFNQSYIIDGSGVYITRNQDYKGVMNLSYNIAYDNGINGLVVHKTSNAAVTVHVEGNVVFGNGRTTRDIEGRQAAGGLVVNHGPPAGCLSLVDNVVFTRNAEDVTYQCFGGCSISDSDSTGNVHCYGAVSNSYPSGVFQSEVDCDSFLDMDGIRAKYPASAMPSAVPQYSFFPGHIFTPPLSASPSPSPGPGPSSEMKVVQASCAAEYGDEMATASGKSWNYYSFGCRNQKDGVCYTNSSFCDTGQGHYEWFPGSTGYCGEKALGVPCGCCAAAPAATTTAPSSSSLLFSPSPSLFSPKESVEPSPSSAPLRVPSPSPAQSTPAPAPLSVLSLSPSPSSSSVSSSPSPASVVSSNNQPSPSVSFRDAVNNLRPSNVSDKLADRGGGAGDNVKADKQPTHRDIIIAGVSGVVGGMLSVLACLYLAKRMKGTSAADKKEGSGAGAEPRHRGISSSGFSAANPMATRRIIRERSANRSGMTVLNDQLDDDEEDEEAATRSTELAQWRSYSNT